MPHAFPRPLVVRALALAHLLVGVAVAAHAAVYTWDPVGNGNSGGHGNWNLTDPFWYNGSSDVVWPNAGPDTAVFAGAGDAVTVTAAIQVNTLTFNSPAYSLSAGTGGSLTLTGSLPTINGTASATINASLAGTAGLTISSAGTVTLGGANTYTGGTNLSAGTLNAASAQAPGASGTISFLGGTLQYGLTNNADYSARFSTAAGQAYNVDVIHGETNVTFASVLGSSAGVLTKLGEGTLTLTANNTYTGGTNFNGGFVIAGSAGALGSTGTLSFGGGSLQYSAANTTDYTARFSTAAGQAYSFDTNGQSVAFAAAPLASPGGTLTKRGDGTLTLTRDNTYTGGTNLWGGVLSVASPGAPGTTGPLSFGGGTLQYGGTNTTDYSARFSQEVSQPFRVDTNGRDITLATGLVSAYGSLTKLGAGTLTLAGGAQLGTSSTTTVSAGVLALPPAASMNTAALNVDGGGTFNSAGTLTGNIYHLATVAGAADATVNVTGGSFSNFQTFAGAVAGSNSVINQSGGTVSTNLYLGTAGPGTYDLSDGTLQGIPWIGYSSTGTFKQTGGSVSATNLILGYNSAGVGSYTISGAGTLTAKDYIDVGYSGKGTFTVDGGTVTVSSQLAFGVALAGGSTGTVNLNAGRLTIPSANGGGGTTSKSTFNFNGGTLQAGMGSTGFVRGFTTANVQAGGAVIDTNGYNDTIPQALLHDTTPGAPALDGGLTKNGAGTLTLTGTNTYTGPTRINEGTLVPGNTGALGSGNTTSIAAPGTLDVSALSGGYTLPAGGTLTNLGTVKGNLNVPGGTVYTGGGTVSGLLTVQSGGLVTVSGGTLTVNGGVVNSGTIRLRQGASLAVGGGTFTNNSGATLDLITGSFSAPAGFTNNGVVIDSGVIKARSVALGGGALTVSVDGYTGHTYQFQRSDSLASPNYGNVGAAQTGTTGQTLTFTDAPASGTQGFYRVQVDP